MISQTRPKAMVHCHGVRSEPLKPMGADCSSSAHYIFEYMKVAGLMVPTRHRIFPQSPDGQALKESLVISIDVSEVAFT